MACKRSIQGGSRLILFDNSIPKLEETVLGCCIVDTTAFPKVQFMLHENAFREPHHKAIFKAIQSTFKEGLDVDPLTVLERLDAKYEPDLAHIACNVVSTGTRVESYALRLRDRWIQREMKSMGKEMANGSRLPSNEHIDSITDRLDKMKTFNKETHVIDIAQEWITILDQINDGRDERIIPTGYKSIDWKIEGFRPGDLISVIGAPSMGKSAFMVNLAWNASKHRPVAVFSMEMTTLSLVKRMISNAAGCTFQQIIDETIPDDWFKYATNNNNRHIYVDESTRLTAKDIKTRLYPLVKRNNVRVAFIDHLGLMKPSGGKHEVENWKLTSRELKAVAKTLDITIVMLNQMDKNSIIRGRPTLQSSRMVGGDDPDVMIGLWRDNWQGKGKDCVNTLYDMLELIVMKARDGQIGIVKCHYWLNKHRIREIDSNEPPKSDEKEPAPF